MKRAGDFDEVQRIVLKGGAWGATQHLVLRFDARHAAPRRFLKLLQQQDEETPTPFHHRARQHGTHPQLQLSLGFSRRGLEGLGVPAYVIRAFATLAPAFHAGAAPRAARCGIDDAENWDPAYAFEGLDAVLTLQGGSPEALAPRLRAIAEAASACELTLTALPPGHAYQAHGNTQQVFFGFRDGVSRVGVEGVSSEAYLRDCKPDSIHAPGEFLLGQQQNCGANPWVSAAMQQLWPADLRRFFHNASFGVLQQIEQHEQAFDEYCETAARGGPFSAREIAAKLCGRTREGQPVGRDQAPMQDFDYADDRDGLKCPYGSHARRMNPRGGELAQTRRRPILRRGTSYVTVEGEKGLLAHFFCASIEDQYEFLLGEWIDRVPLGSPDPGGARDPLMGMHSPGDGPFVIPTDQGLLKLPPLPRMSRTRGSAYLFYPSVTALRDIADNAPFADLSELGR